jgi:hypothetical protein
MIRTAQRQVHHAAPAFHRDLNTKIAGPVDITKAPKRRRSLDGTTMAFRIDAEGAAPASCAGCHSLRACRVHREQRHGRCRWLHVVTTGVGRHPANGFACTTCHNDLTKYTLYPVTNVPFPSGKNDTFSTADADGNLKPVAATLCQECHQGRQSTQTVNARIGATKDDEPPKTPLTFANVHYFAASFALRKRCSGGIPVPSTAVRGCNMHAPGFQACTDCHNTHELGLKIDKCATCHPGVKSAEEIRLASGDLDGDKDVKEGVAGELTTMEEKLYAAIQAYAKDVIKTPIAYTPDANPYFFIDTNANGKADEDEVKSANRYPNFTPRLLRAAYTYQYAQKDPGLFTHNPKYVAQILYDALEDLGKGGVKVDMTGLVRPAVPAQ